MSFLIVDVSTKKHFRCEIDALNYPVDGLFTATSDFDMFYQSGYDVYPAIILPVKELKPQPAKRLPRRT
jgi:hypothetical protein